MPVVGNSSVPINTGRSQMPPVVSATRANIPIEDDYDMEGFNVNR